MKIGIVTVPYITVQRHFDLAVETLESFKSQHELVNIGIVNHIEEQFKPLLDIYDYYELNQENCLSSAWNKGIQKAREVGCAMVFLPNLDIVLHPKALDMLVELGLGHRNTNCILWTGTVIQSKEELNSPFTLDKSYITSPQFSCFMIFSDFIETLASKDVDVKWSGRFCELFKPAYYEDNDMHRRINLAGFEARSYISPKFYHYESQTIKSDRTILEGHSARFSKVQQTYINRWGGLPGKELYTSPRIH